MHQPNDQRQGAQIEMFPTAVKARDAGLKQVRENSGNWFIDALKIFDGLRHYHQGQTMIAEDFKRMILSYINPPHHHNIWGAFTRECARRKWIVDTEKRTKAQTVKSHAREIRIWRVL